ncbi:hypothetical protein Tco_0584476 [Tanacetum coccineum]
MHGGTPSSASDSLEHGALPSFLILFLIVLFAELFEIYSGCSSRGALGSLFVLPYRILHIRPGMARGRLFVIAHGQWIPHNYVLHSTPVDFESLNLALLMSELHLQPLLPRHQDIGRIKS